MRYNNNITYRIYTRGLTKGEITHRLRTRLDISLEDFPIGYSGVPGDIEWSRLVHTQDGMLLTGVNNNRYVTGGGNVLLYVGHDKFYDGHLDDYGHDNVTVYLTTSDSFKPMTYCQSHSMG